jgi:hypothetical protein
MSNKAKMVASKTIPVMEKGVSAVYGTLATGFDFGLKGVNTLTKMSKKHKHRKKCKTCKTYKRF